MRASRSPRGERIAAAAGVSAGLLLALFLAAVIGSFVATLEFGLPT